MFIYVLFNFNFLRYDERYGTVDFWKINYKIPFLEYCNVFEMGWNEINSRKEYISVQC